jgi:hypothetical protein
LKINDYVWAIFVAESTNRFPNFFPIGVYTNEIKAKQELEGLPKDNNYQLFKFPTDQFFGYFNKKGELVGMDKVNHWHYYFKDDLEGI